MFWRTAKRCSFGKQGSMSVLVHVEPSCSCQCSCEHDDFVKKLRDDRERSCSQCNDTSSKNLTKNLANEVQIPSNMDMYITTTRHDDEHEDDAVFETATMEVSSNGIISFQVAAHDDPIESREGGVAESSVFFGEDSSCQFSFQEPEDDSSLVDVATDKSGCRPTAVQDKQSRVTCHDMTDGSLPLPWPLSQATSVSSSSLCSLLSASSSTCMEARKSSTSRQGVGRGEDCSNERNQRKIKLQASDEIHVSPCQCALSLANMRGCFLLPPADENVIKFSRSASVPLDGTSRSRTHVRASSMVRTASAQAAVNTERKVGNRCRLDSGCVRSQCQRLSAAGPDLKLLENVHDVTLIRVHQNQEKDDDISEDHVRWAAATIRCRDHDEMDALICLLRKSSKATVVPFSPFPNKRRRHTFCRQTHSQRMGREKDRSIEPTVALLTDAEEPTSARRRSMANKSKNAPFLRKNSRKNAITKKQRDKWNKNDHCEFCGFHFTLLTRRHHCRKCDKSVCSDCSFQIILRDCEETRFCNRCNSDVISKQSGNQHRRVDSSCVFGTVHPACHRVGVGVMGMLPHWKNYFALQRQFRPAVGRLTVEVIEALALPNVDLNGKSDPYVRATITGFDYDLKWNLQEWLPSNQFSLSTSYCSATLSPLWRGPGLRGGELLTLPVVSTSGAVLRLEVLHFDVIANNALGKDPILGVVEIPLSDFPNANVRKPDPAWSNEGYDGFVDRWYALNMPEEHTPGMRKSVVLGTPIESPYVQDGNQDQVSSPKKTSKVAIRKFVHSMEEIGQLTEKVCRAPLEWVGSALGIDVPRRAPSVCEQRRRSRSCIHVRIKLNVSEVGDLLSHSWMPLIRLKPERPPFDPQTTLSRIRRISKEIQPYLKIFKFIDDAVKWKHPYSVCFFCYVALIFHVAFYRHFLYLIHGYSLAFLVCRSINAKAEGDELQFLGNNESDGLVDDDQVEGQCAGSKDSDASSAGDGENSFQPTALDESIDENTPKTKRATSECRSSPSLNDLKRQTESFSSGARDEFSLNDQSNKDEEDTARLNRIVSWLAKKIGDNHGLEVLQHKLGLFEQDVTKLNVLWDGSSPLKTKIAIAAVGLSFIVHLHVNNARVLWIVGISASYFLPSPIAQHLLRANFGVGRGVAKVLRRRHLNLLEEEIYDM